MKKIIILLTMLLIPFTAISSVASQMRVFVAGMSATGVQNRDEMQLTLQTLLASRLNSDKIIAVGSTGEADIVVSGTYVSIGKIFSLDAIAKTAAGKIVTREFVQGESQDELIPAIGKLAEKLSADLIKLYPAGQLAAVTQPSLATVPAVGAGPVPGSDVIKPKSQVTNSAAAWLSKRLAGAANLMAVGKLLSDGSREIFLAGDRRIAYYRQGSDMKLLSEAELGNGYKIISLDTVDGNNDSVDIYVTIIRAGELSSQVWQIKADKLVRVAADLPYYFRAIKVAGWPKKLYAQAMGRDVDYYGDVAEATRSGSVITLKNPFKLPRYGTIYTFNKFHDRDGKTFTVVINPDGYLVVYDEELKELWRSNDKFGGSELYFQREDDANFRVTGDKYRWIFMNQCIQVTSKGEILIGKNEGFWVLGNARSYKRGAVYCLLWNGSSLDEKWRTQETQNYMPDYFYDEAHNELLILQTVQRPGITTNGASSLTIRKVE
ncbi:MAG: VCBS repeat-containing protein [Desulfuromonadaceae bacterium]|nr:VCBS repeat-containing protein [Desulfuromonadaceae bacterium]